MPDTPPNSSGSSEGAASSGSGLPPEKIDAPSILEIEEDLCPKCGNVLKPGEVVCMKCGFDLRTNAAHAPRVGVEHVEEIPVVDPGSSSSATSAAAPSNADRYAASTSTSASASEPVSVGSRARRWFGGLSSAVDAASGAGGSRRLQEEFSVPGRGNVQTLLIFAAALVVSAMVIAGIDAPTGRFWPTAGRVILTLYITLLATGLGLAAVAVVARISDMRLGRPDLATARILVAFGAFQTLRGINFPAPPLLVHLLMWSAGIAAYWGLVMFLFRKPRHIAGYVLITHFMLYLALVGGMELWGRVTYAEAEAIKAKAAVQATP